MAFGIPVPAGGFSMGLTLKVEEAGEPLSGLIGWILEVWAPGL